MKSKKILASVATLLCLSLVGCSTGEENNGNNNGGGDENPPQSDWRDNMIRDDNDFLKDDNAVPPREPFVDTTPIDEGEKSPFRFEAENAKIFGTSAGVDHFCTGKSLEFSPSFSGNVSLCNLGTATLSYRFESDKNVRSPIKFRMSNQMAGDTGGVLGKYVNVTVNGKPVVDLTKSFDVETGEPAEGSSETYFTMVTLESEISIFKGANTIEITPEISNGLNLDYIEINTSANLENKTQSTLKDPSKFVNISSAPTATTKGKIAFNCEATKDGKPCGNQNARARNLPDLTSTIYTKEEVENGVYYTLQMFDGNVVVSKSLSYRLTLTEGAKFEDDSTSKMIFNGEVPVIKIDVPENKVLIGWEDQDGNKYDVSFPMPEKDITIKPIFAAKNIKITIDGAKIDGSATIETGIGESIDLTKAVADVTPEGMKLVGFVEADALTKIYTETYTVNKTTTLKPVFDTVEYINKTDNVGKIEQTGNVYEARNKGLHSIIDNKTTGAILNEKGYLEVASIYHAKGRTIDAPTEKIEVDSYLVTQEMNNKGLNGEIAEGRTISTRVHNFTSEAITLRFALIKSSGNPNSQYGEKIVTIPANETITFTFDVTYLHGASMYNIMVKENAVSELHLGVYTYVNLKG